MKKLGLLIVSLVLVFALVACGSSPASTPSANSSSEAAGQPAADASEAPAEAQDIYVALFPKAFAGDFWKTVELGAVQAAEENGITLTYEGTDTESDIEQQVQFVENAITKRADVIAIACLDNEALVPVAEQANEAGIKVITFNSAMNSDIPATHIATDNWAAGELAGKALGEAMGGTGKYAVIGAVESVKNNRDRSEGAVSYITEHFPDMELITIQYTDADLNRALAVTSDIITANPDIGGIFSNNETTTIGATTVLKEKGKSGEIVHVGFDATIQTIENLKDGTSAAIVTQDPFNMGYQTVINALKVLNGETVEPIIDTGVALVTPENLETPEMQKIVNPLG